MLNVLFALFTLKSCTKLIRPPIGVVSHKVEINSDDLLCIDPSVYPTHLIFIDFPADTLLMKYHSVTNRGSPSDLRLLYETPLRFLPLFISDIYPFSTYAFKSQITGNINIVSVVLPGMCTSGIFFSGNLLKKLNSLENKSNENGFKEIYSNEKIFNEKNFNEKNFNKEAPVSYNFSWKLDEKYGFWKINPYDDKCLVFTSLKSINLEIKSLNNEDQLYYYSDFENFTSIHGNSTLSATFNEAKPVLVRIVSEDKNISFDSTTISATVIYDYSDDNESTASTTTIRSDLYLPPYKTEKCKEEKNWFNKLAIATTLIVILLILVFLVYFMASTEFYGKKGDEAESCDSMGNSQSYEHFESPEGSEDDNNNLLATPFNVIRT